MVKLKKRNNIDEEDKIQSIFLSTHSFCKKSVCLNIKKLNWFIETPNNLPTRGPGFYREESGPVILAQYPLD